MRIVRMIGVCASVAVCALTGLDVHAQGNGEGGRKPKYHVNVVEWTSVVFYGDDINDRGQLALTGASSEVEFGELARRWDAREGFLSLAPENSHATGINNRGDVTVVERGLTIGTPWSSSLWTERDGLVSIPSLGGSHAFADAVNDRGEVVGWSNDAGGNRHAFLWTLGEGIRSLGDLPGGNVSSTAHHITDQGLVVGHSYAEGSQFAFRWTDDEGMASLGDLAGGRAESAAFGANDRGQIVGVGHIDGDLARAVLWTEDGEILDLGALKPGDHSMAADVNRQGEVVGWSVKSGGGIAVDHVPFLWTQEHGMLDLHTLLDDDSAGWRLAGVNMGGINDRGEILLSGSLDGQFARIVLTPINPEPAMLLTCVSGGLLLLRRRGAGGAAGGLAMSRVRGHTMAA